ncbi:MAG: nucleotidyltransferase family protein [Candidatus Omnitrophota bacterium]
MKDSGLLLFAGAGFSKSYNFPDINELWDISFMPNLVLVYKRNRFSRNLKDLLMLFGDFLKGRSIYIKAIEEIRAILLRHKNDICERLGIVEIGIFGSYVRSEQCEDSDVDILVAFRETPDLFRFCELERKLEEILKCKVDLVRKQAVRSELKEIILKEEVLL